MDYYPRCLCNNLPPQIVKRVSWVDVETLDKRETCTHWHQQRPNGDSCDGGLGAPSLFPSCGSRVQGVKAKFHVVAPPPLAMTKELFLHPHRHPRNESRHIPPLYSSENQFKSFHTLMNKKRSYKSVCNSTDIGCQISRFLIAFMKRGESQIIHTHLQ